MKVRPVILAGGEGSRLGVLTAKRTKPAVPFAGKYRIIDFALSNCVNSGLFDVHIVAQYRPQSLMEHIGAGGPWDLNRDFTGGVRIYTPYKARRPSDWFTGTADAVQQNFLFLKRGSPDLLLILSGDHIYSMDYEPMITFHIDHQADVTLATINVTREEATRFGIVGADDDYRVKWFVEKPADPPATTANMGVYIFNLDVLDRALWEDHIKTDSAHDFGKDILPGLVQGGARVFAYPYSGYWMDVGTTYSYWRAHMDLLQDPPPLNLNDRRWVIHTRTEERPPAWISSGAEVGESMISDGCVISAGAKVNCSVLSPGVRVEKGAVVENSVVLTDCVIQAGAKVVNAVLDKRVVVGENTQVGSPSDAAEPELVMIGKNSTLPADMVARAGSSIGCDVIPSDFTNFVVETGEYIQTRRLPNEI